MTTPIRFVMENMHNNVFMRNRKPGGVIAGHGSNTCGGMMTQLFGFENRRGVFCVIEKKQPRCDVDWRRAKICGLLCYIRTDDVPLHPVAGKL